MHMPLWNISFMVLCNKALWWSVEHKHRFEHLWKLGESPEHPLDVSVSFIGSLVKLDQSCLALVLLGVMELCPSGECNFGALL